METNNLYIWSIKNIKSNRISIHAAQVAFFIMVSFFPFLMFFITLLKHTPSSPSCLRTEGHSCQFKFPYLNVAE